MLGAPWAAAVATAPEPVVVIGRAKSGTVDLRQMVPGLLERAGGMGGGSPDLIQASAADASHAEVAWRWAVEEMEK